MHLISSQIISNMKNAFILFFLLMVASLLSAQQEMTNTRIHEIFTEEADEMEGEGGVWQLSYGSRLLLIVTDSSANRMRIFTPVFEQAMMEEGQMEKMLEANFHSALDAKYSLYEGYVVSVFTHPLKELTKEQLIDAMRQVVILADTFGTTYQSTDMIFGGGQEEEPKVNESPLKEKRN